MLQNFIYVVPGLAAGVAALLGRISFTAAGLIIGTLVVFAIVIDFWRFTHYQCGRCRRTLPAPSRWWVLGVRDRIVFTCVDCGVLWRTQLSREE